MFNQDRVLSVEDALLLSGDDIAHTEYEDNRPNKFRPREPELHDEGQLTSSCSAADTAKANSVFSLPD